MANSLLDATGMNLDEGDYFIYIPAYSTPKPRIAQLLEVIDLDDPSHWKLKLKWKDIEMVPCAYKAKVSVITANLDYHGKWSKAISLDYTEYLKESLTD